MLSSGREFEKNDLFGIGSAIHLAVAFKMKDAKLIPVYYFLDHLQQLCKLLKNLVNVVMKQTSPCSRKLYPTHTY